MNNITKGTLVRYLGNKEPLWNGKLLMVHDRVGEQIIVWHERKQNGKYTKLTLNVREVEVVV